MNGERRLPAVAASIALGLTISAWASCPTLVGDVNSDGVANISDTQCVILATLAYVAKEPPPVCASAGFPSADLDCSSAVSVVDVQLSIAITLGLDFSLAVDADANGCPDGCDAAPCTPAACNDGNDCTVDHCGADGLGCEHTPVVDDCCHDNGAVGCAEQPACEQCVCGWSSFCCDVAWDESCARCARGEFPICRDYGCDAVCVCNGGCDDGSDCTVFDHCEAGECVSEPINDGTPNTCCTAHPSPSCTAPSCAACVCGFSPGCCTTAWSNQCAAIAQSGLCQGSCGCLHAGCEDGDLCTIGEQCVGASCVAGGSLHCDDGNPCTADSCDPAVGCQAIPLSEKSCNDGDACTDNDVCTLGQCTGQQAVFCDDGIDCTEDRCNPAGVCQFVAQPGACDDGDPCTKDSCDPAVGCVSTPFADPDGSSCCQAHAGAGCDTPGCPSCVCQLDPTCCIAGGWDSGCVSLAKSVFCSDACPCSFESCDDGDPCTTADHCAAGECVSNDDAFCFDGDPCTTDDCAEGVGCVFAPVTGPPCEDGSLCTTDEFCVAGSCVGVLVADCDDGVACTSDSCTSAGACVHSYIHSQCDDGNVCTTDICTASGCTVEPIPDPSTSTCCSNLGQNLCAPAGCQQCVCQYDFSCCGQQPWDSGCATVASSVLCYGVCGCQKTFCDDGDPCTTGDYCKAGVCVGGRPLTAMTTTNAPRTRVSPESASPPLWATAPRATTGVSVPLAITASSARVTAIRLRAPTATRAPSMPAIRRRAVYIRPGRRPVVSPALSPVASSPRVRRASASRTRCAVSCNGTHPARPARLVRAQTRLAAAPTAAPVTARAISAATITTTVLATTSAWPARAAA